MTNSQVHTGQIKEYFITTPMNFLSLNAYNRAKSTEDFIEESS